MRKNYQCQGSLFGGCILARFSLSPESKADAQRLRAGRKLPVVSSERHGSALQYMIELLFRFPHMTKSLVLIALMNNFNINIFSIQLSSVQWLRILFFSPKCRGFNTIPSPHTFPFFVFSLCNRNSLKNLDPPLVLAGVWLLSARVFFFTQLMDENFTALRHNFN